MYRSTAYLLDVLFFVFAQRSGAQTTDVDSVATEIARLHNLSADALLDDITVSTSAMAVGKNVIVTDHLKVTASEHSLEALLELKAKRKEKIVARTAKPTSATRHSRRACTTPSISSTAMGEELPRST